MANRAVVLSDVSKVYPRDLRALDRVSFAVERGAWIAVMGPSGSGKTTLLNIIAGLDTPTSGTAEALGTEITGLGPDGAAIFRREHIGLVFQQFHLIPYLTALENVMLAQYYHSMIDRAQAMEMLEWVGLADRAGQRSAHLSGGEKQRVCIARALVNEPEIILADEPTGNLDEANEQTLLEILRRLHEQGKTLIVVTHSRTLGQAAGRTLHLRHGQIVADSLGAGRGGGGTAGSLTGAV